MRSYGQFCGLAKSLDVVGDRWTLLIVRELLIRGPSRYTDLRSGLPGIPTNLLADRLRDMEEAGLLRRARAAGPGPPGRGAVRPPRGARRSGPRPPPPAAAPPVRGAGGGGAGVCPPPGRRCPPAS